MTVLCERDPGRPRSAVASHPVPQSGFPGALRGRDTPAAVSRRYRWVLLLLALLLAAIAAGVAASRRAEPVAAIPDAPPAVVPAFRSAIPPPPPALARASSSPAPLVPVPDPSPGPTAGSPAPVIDEGYPVQLEKLRTEIPKNRYWLDSEPTNDPEVLKRREVEAAAWNDLHGKVLSGTATSDEIRTWVDHRRQVSQDAIEFAQRVLDEHGSELPDRDRGLLELAIQMHRTRLDELPRQESEARARKVEQDRRRAEWKAGSPTP